MTTTSSQSQPSRHHSAGDHHPHTHGAVDPAIFASERGIWAVKWSFVWLLATALFQVFIVLLSGSVALLADTLHNFADAGTAIPLWVAFSLSRLKPSKRFTYGLGRVEDLAGAFIVFTILLSACLAGYQSILRLLHPQELSYLWAVALASIIGFIGNELVALFRIKVGKEIGSAALIADGYHSRVDGLTSLAVLLGAIGVYLGFPLSDPLVGILITIVILKIVWDSGKSVFMRTLDGVEPEAVDEIRDAVSRTEGVREVTEVRVRWIGHRLFAELNIAVDPDLSVDEAHNIASDARHRLLHQLPFLSNATIHVDPAYLSGDGHHRIPEHSHDSLPPHSH